MSGGLLHQVQAPLLRAWQAATLRADFRMSYWNVTRKEARAWLVVAVLANLVAQLAVGYPNLLSILGGLVTPAFFWSRPPRLTAGVGGLLTVQALGSIVVIVTAVLVGLPKLVVEGCALAWALYCVVALLMLALKYIRTPKTQMP